MSPGKLRIGLAPLSLLVGIAACTEKSTYNLDSGTDEIAIGALYVAAEKCASCHAAAGSSAILAGDDAVTPGSTAYGENLTPDVQSGLGSWADIQIVRALRFGLDTSNQALCAAMPIYPNMSDLEANAIVAYLRSLPAVSHTVPNSVCPPVKPRPVDDFAVAVDLASADGGE